MKTEEEKWQFCPDHHCPRCRFKIAEKDVKKEELVTHCPYCNASFVE